MEILSNKRLMLSLWQQKQKYIIHHKRLYVLHFTSILIDEYNTIILYVYMKLGKCCFYPLLLIALFQSKIMQSKC